MAEDSNSSSENVKSILGEIANLVDPNSPREKLNEKSAQFEGLSADALDAILSSKLPDADPAVDAANPSLDVRWRFVLHGLQRLRALKLRLAEAEGEKSGWLSVKEQKQVGTLVQMVSAFGLLPNLVPGVGLPLEKRSQFVRCLREKKEEATEVSVEEKYQRLCHVTKAIFDLVEEKTLSGLILTKHLGDLMSALIQLGHAPLKKPNPNQDVDQRAATTDFVMTEEKFEKLQADQTLFRSHLIKLMNRVYQPLVIKYLLVIQSSGSSSSSSKSDIKSPRWLQRVCGELLSDRLMRDNGVMNVIRGVLDIGGGQDDTAEVQQKSQIIAQVLSSPPSSSAYGDVEKYYARICPQILDILSLKDDCGDSKQFHVIACACVKSVSERSLILSRRHLFDVMMKPLLTLTDDDTVHKDVVVTEDSLADTINLLHMVFVQCNEPSSVFLSHLDPAILVLLDLHCSITYGVSHLKQPVEQLLKRYIKCSGNEDAVRALRCFALHEKPDKSKTRLRTVKKNLKFVSGEKGGVTVKEDDEAEEQFFVDDDEKSIALVDLLQGCNDTSLSVDFFMTLLRDLSDIMVQKEEEDPDKSNDAKPMETRLLEFEADLDRTMETLRRNLMVIRLLGLLSDDDKIQSSIMKDSEQLLNFVTLTVRRAALVVSQKSKEEVEDSSNVLESQSLNMALTLLSVKLTRPDVSVPEWQRLQAIVGDLRTLEEGYGDERVRSMARRLRQLVATHGAILDHKNEIEQKCEKIISKTNQLKDLAKKMKDVTMEQAASDTESKSGYEKALYDLTDPLIPTRGHGLISLTRLVQDKDEETLKNINKVIDIFKENLEDDETYIYLQAINGLVSCANFNPDLVVDLLTREFAHVDDRKSLSDKSVEIRTKIGEALVKITENLNELTPAFKNRLINPFLAQVNHPDFLVRATCLSNIGEVCKNLRFSLGNIVQEIFLCLHQCLEFDQSIEVRRAAVMVVAMILQGLGVDSFTILKHLLKDIGRTLLRLRDTETDEPLLHHTAVAIQRINEIVRTFLQPTAEMSKTIYVLDAPPDSF